MSMIFMIYCFFVFLDSTKTAYPKLPLPTIFTFLYFYILTVIFKLYYQKLELSPAHKKSYANFLACCRIEYIFDDTLEVDLFLRDKSKWKFMIWSFFYSFSYQIACLFCSTMSSNLLAESLKVDAVFLN